MPQIRGDVDVRTGLGGGRQERVTRPAAHRDRSGRSRSGSPAARTPATVAGSRPATNGGELPQAHRLRQAPDPAAAGRAAIGMRRPAAAGRSARATPASASLTPPTALSALVCAAKWATPAADHPVDQRALRGVGGDRLHGPEQQRVVGEQQTGAEPDRLVDRRRSASTASSTADHVGRIAAGQADPGVPFLGEAGPGRRRAPLAMTSTQRATTMHSRVLGGSVIPRRGRRSVGSGQPRGDNDPVSSAARSRPIDTRFHVCVVCPGNICRSPIGEQVLRAAIADAGLDDRVRVSSAGIGDWHVGQGAQPAHGPGARGPPATRARPRARQITRPRLADVDLVLAADRGHLRELRAMTTIRTRSCCCAASTRTPTTTRFPIRTTAPTPGSTRCWR